MFRLFKRDTVTETDRIIAARGIRAKDFLENSVYAEVMEELEEDFCRAFHNTAPDNYEARELFYQHMSNLQAIDAKLKTWVGEGELAQMKLDEEEQ